MFAVQFLDAVRSHPPLPDDDAYGEDYDDDTSVVGRSAKVSVRVAPRAVAVGCSTEQGTSRPAVRTKRRRVSQVVYSSDSDKTASDEDNMTLGEWQFRQDRIEAQKRMDEALESAAARKAQTTSTSSRGPSQVPPPLVCDPPRRVRTPDASKTLRPSSEPPTAPATTEVPPFPEPPAPEAVKRKADYAGTGSQDRPRKRFRSVSMKKATRYVVNLVVICFL